MITGPVVEQIPIRESDRVRVFEVPSSVLYRTEVKQPDGTTKVFDAARAYTKSLQITKDGNITIEVAAKSDKIKNSKIPYPYHYLFRDEVLCALKVFNMETKSGAGSISFALNYNLFCLPWSLCVIAHTVNGKNLGFFASRAEWERGEITCHNREVQMFLSIPEERHIDLNLIQLMVAGEITAWIDKVKREIVRKSKA